MAIKKTIEIDLNSNAASEINNITNSIEGTDKATQSLRSQLRQAQSDVAELSDKFGATSKEAIEAAKRAGELKDAIGDAKALTDAFNPDAKFSALSGSLAGVASGFSAVEGGLALTGVESEKLQETMVRLQAAMALSQGLQGLGESIDSFKQMGAVAKNALSGIRTGIAATGIGVLLIALGAVVAYWDDIKSAVNGVSSEQENLNKLAQTNLDAEQSKLDTIGSQDNVLKLQGKSEKDILKIKIAQTDQVIKATENQIVQNDITAKAQIEAAERNKTILKGILEFLSIPFQTVLKTIDSIGAAIGEDFGLSKGFSKLLDKGASLIFDPAAERAAAEATRKESLKSIEKLKNDKAGLQLSLQGIDKQAATDSARKRKEANDKEIQDAKDKADALERIRQGEIDTQAERRAEELRQVQQQYKQLIAEAEKFGQDTTALKEAQRTKEKELQDKFDAEDKEKQAAKTLKEQEEKIVALELTKEFDNLTFEAKREELKTKENLLLEDKTLTEEQRNNLEKSYAEARNRIAQAEADQKAAIQNAVLDNVAGGIGVLKQLGEKNKGVQKAAIIAENAVGIARIILNTQAANAKSVAASPLTGGMPWVAVNTIGGALGVASSLLATKKALSELGGGSVSSPSVGGGSGGGGSMSAAAAAPQFNVVGNTGVNQLAQTLGNQQPVQAFVVANQVTSQQALDRNIVNNASIG
jgi:hypothetical protein